MSTQRPELLQHCRDILDQNDQEILIAQAGDAAGYRLLLGEDDLDLVSSNSRVGQAGGDDPDDLTPGPAPEILVLLQNHMIQPGAAASHVAQVFVPPVPRGGDHPDAPADRHPPHQIHETLHRGGVVGIVHQHLPLPYP